MKRQSIIVLLLLLGLAMPTMAQNNKEEERVKLARDQYARSLEKIATIKEYEENEIPNINYTTVVRQQNWAGSGMMDDQIEFYYNEIEDEMEPYPVGYNLLFVRRAYNLGSMEYFEEYVYDDNANPLFWFTQYGYKENGTFKSKVELRGYYYADGTLARTIGEKTEDNDPFSHALQNFKKFKAVFDSLYSVEY